MTQIAPRATQQVEKQQFDSITHEPMNKQQRRLYSYIVACLLDSGNLNDNKQGIMALTKQAKVTKSELKTFITKARDEHPQIDSIARITKWISNNKIENIEVSHKTFERLLPATKKAGKDEIWLSKQLGYKPPNMDAEVSKAIGKTQKMKSLFKLKRTK